MSNPPDDGGPAFPSPGDTEWNRGLSIRDWFAGEALKGLLAGPDTSGSGGGFADAAYRFADAMIRERKRQKEDDA